jgi:L-ribulose-5-phosphate 3-epimerase
MMASGAAATTLARGARLTRGNVCFITDEVSRDLGVALKFASEFGVKQVELRAVDNMYCFRHDPEKLKQIHAQLREHGIRVAILSTPVLKCVLPGSTLTTGSAREVQAAQKDFPVPVEEQFAQQLQFLRKSIEAARILETDRLRIFSYWRVEDREKERPRIVEGLRRITEVAEKEKVRLCIENEPGCNLANCRETSSVLKEISSPALGMNWDIANGLSTGEKPYPDGFDLLDKKRIWHVHIKDSRRNPDTGRRQTCAVGDGEIPYREIFPALAAAGYSGALSMETHFSINGSREPASRRSMEGLLKVVDNLS